MICLEKLDCDIKYVVIKAHRVSNIRTFVDSFCSSHIKFCYPHHPVYLVKKCYVLDNFKNDGEKRYLVVPTARYKYLKADQAYSELLYDLEKYYESGEVDDFVNFGKTVTTVSCLYDDFSSALDERNKLNADIKSHLIESLKSIVSKGHYHSILYSRDVGIAEWVSDVDASIEEEQLKQCKLDFANVVERSSKDDNRENPNCSHGDDSYSDWYLQPFEEDMTTFWGVRRYNNAVERYCHECGCVERVRGKYENRYFDVPMTTEPRYIQRRKKQLEKKMKHSFY